MYTLAPHEPIIIKISKNCHTSHTLVGVSIDLMVSDLDSRGLTPFLLTQKLKYSVSVCLKNESSVFTSNTDSTSYFKTFSGTLRWSITFSIYAHTILKPSNSLDIFSWNILVIL